MKNNLTSLLACAAAVNLSSCVSRQVLPVDCEIEGQDLPGAISPYPFDHPNPEEYILNQVIESEVDVISHTLDDVDTAEEAEDLADTLDTLRTAIEAAKKLDIEFPDQAIEAYNEALEHLVKNNYFGSAQVREALSDESPL